MIFSLKKIIVIGIIILFVTYVKDKNPVVKYVGSVESVMRRGALNATIELDTVATRTSLYALGPVEGLRGELMVWDGASYVSEVGERGLNKVRRSYRVGAPFLVYCNVKNWKEFTLKNTIGNLSELQDEIQNLAKSNGFDLQTAFPFKISGLINEAEYHVIWKDPEIKEHSHEIHKKSKVFYPVSRENADILGFYSQNHAGVFTHHDSFIHAHIISADRNKMGHLDGISINSGDVRVYLPDLD